mgnify:CR=1 FL=1
MHQFTRDNRVSLEFTPSTSLVKEPNTGKTILKGHVESGLYNFSVASSSTVACLTAHVSVSTWHSRLGHPSRPILSILRSQAFIFFKDFFSINKTC